MADARVVNQTSVYLAFQFNVYGIFVLIVIIQRLIFLILVWLADWLEIIFWNIETKIYSWNHGRIIVCVAIRIVNINSLQPKIVSTAYRSQIVSDES